LHKSFRKNDIYYLLRLGLVYLPSLAKISPRCI